MLASIVTAITDNQKTGHLVIKVVWRKFYTLRRIMADSRRARDRAKNPMEWRQCSERGTIARRVMCLAVMLCIVPACQPGASGSWGGIRGVDKTNFLRLRGGQKSDGAGNPDKKDIQMPILNNMLRISTALTNVSSEEHQARTPLDPDRLAFLRNAMAEMLENTTDVFVMSVENLQLDEDSDENVHLKIVALENIIERVDHMDLAVGLR